LNSPLVSKQIYQVMQLQKTSKYPDLTVTLRQQYNDVKLISLYISTLGIISFLSTTFIEMLKDTKVENIHQRHTLKNICHFHKIYVFHLLRMKR